MEPNELGQGLFERPVGVDLEAVRLFPTKGLPADVHGQKYVPPGAVVSSLLLIMRRELTSWSVAAVGGQILRPGWPPQHEQLIPDGEY
jgi:hypothetical protein